MSKEQKKLSFVVENETYNRMLYKAQQEGISLSAYIRRLAIRAVEPQRIENAEQQGKNR